MTDTMVRYYSSAMSGSPDLSGTAGALITLLDACLVNGFGEVTLTGDKIVVADDVATCSVSGGHNFAMFGDNVIGPVVRIGGVTGDYATDLNKDFRIASVASNTEFTFATTGVPDGTYSSGTITAKRSPAGFSKTYSGTNKAAYRADDTGTGSTRFYFRVDDSNTYYGLVRGYESMSDVDTGTNAFPTTTQVAAATGRWMKSSSADGTERGWVLLADSRRFAFFPLWSGSNTTTRDAFFFGDLDSYLTGDAYCCMCSMRCIASNNYVGYGQSLFQPLYATNDYTGHFARSYTQLGTAVAAKLIHPYAGGSENPIGYDSSTYQIMYPNPINRALILTGPLEYYESVGIRGKLSGFYGTIQRIPLTDLDVIEGVSDLSGRALLVLKIASSGGGANEYPGRVFVDLTSWQD